MPGFFKKISVVAVLAVSSAVLLNQLVFLLGLTNVSEGYREVMKIYEELGPVVLFIMAVFAAPVYEEAVFRGLLYGLPLFLTGRFGTQEKRKKLVPVFAVLSSVLFAAYHGNLVQFVYALIMAFMMCLVYESCGGLFWTIIFHMLANLSTLLSGIFREYPDSPVTMAVMVLLACVSIICIRYLIMSVAERNGHVHGNGGENIDDLV